MDAARYTVTAARHTVARSHGWTSAPLAREQVAAEVARLVRETSARTVKIWEAGRAAPVSVLERTEGVFQVIAGRSVTGFDRLPGAPAQLSA